MRKPELNLSTYDKLKIKEFKETLKPLNLRFNYTFEDVGVRQTDGGILYDFKIQSNAGHELLIDKIEL